MNNRNNRNDYYRGKYSPYVRHGVIVDRTMFIFFFVRVRRPTIFGNDASAGYRNTQSRTTLSNGREVYWVARVYVDA